MIVIDTSIAFKWFNQDEADFALALRLLEDHLSGKNPIFAPDLLLYELTNAWSTKTGLTAEKIDKNLRLLEKFRLNLVPINFQLCRLSSKMAKKYRVSVYDAVYAVLAQEKKCSLLTADEKFKEKVKISTVKLISN